jgi:hypothetical protein
MNSMGGGGGGGGAVVQQTSPWAAMVAGQFQNQAALSASAQAQEAINQAITSINRNYNQARYDVQPYRTTGVQALNQLNQYMGLDAYNPGKAPTAPIEPTIQNLLGKVTDQQMQDYVGRNTHFVNNGKNKLWQYTGANPNSVSNVTRPDGSMKYDGIGPGIYESVASFPDPWAFLNTGSLKDSVRYGVAEEMSKQLQEQYGVDKDGYDQNLLEYNQNLEMYNKYKSEGPLSSQEVTDKITNLPGYQAELGQGINAIQKAGGAAGYLGSGRLLKELSGYGQNTLSKFYGNELSRLAGLAGSGQQAASQTAQGSMNQGNALAGMYSSLGDIKANSALAGGNALAQAFTAANQQFKVIGGQGGGGMGGIGSLLGGIGSLYSAYKGV